MASRNLKSLKITFPEIINAVDSSDKKRFALLHIPSAQPIESTTQTTTLPSTSPDAEHEAAKFVGEDQPATSILESAPATSENQQTATDQALSVKDTNPANFLIRATQGHSIKTVDAASFLEPLSLSDESKIPDTVVHGTFHSTWPLILQSGGLRCMGRNHIHFATGPSLDSVLALHNGDAAQGTPKPDESRVISGMRRDAQVLIYIDIRKALAAGVPFWRSENGVILSEGMLVSNNGEDGKKGEEQKFVSLNFFDVVAERKISLGKLWERGEVLKELPASLTNKGNPKARR
jgi:2'-phosphotransferase